MANVLIPPIKCQGIKSKLVPWIKEYIDWDEKGRWIEPFSGSGVVGFNVGPKRALFCDNNPHIIAFYTQINLDNITPGDVRSFLEEEGKHLSQYGKDYYYQVRDRFNEHHDPLDFLFLNRSCFNGVIRFNSKGEFNVPFGHKPERFSKSYITKIVNQVKTVHQLCQLNEWEFLCQDFRETLSVVKDEDFVYCDPPYVGRHTGYFNTWGDANEVEMFERLQSCGCRFLLSTWHSNEHRQNPYLERLWSVFHVVTREHFYHVGAKESNRKPMLEALVMNYETEVIGNDKGHYVQTRFLEFPAEYQIHGRTGEC